MIVTVKIQLLSPLEFSSLTPLLVNIYLEAMGYATDIRESRIKAWRLAIQEKNFRAVCAHDDDVVLGVAYGYHGHREQWWDQEVRRGLRERGGATSDQIHMLNNYFVVTEIHVTPTCQGQGIGNQLLTTLLSHAAAPFALLSTPEVAHEDNNAFRLYRTTGFYDLIRHFYFRGDTRAFAIMAKALSETTTT